MYNEMRRVLPTGGRLAFFDILAGPTQPLGVHLLIENAPEKGANLRRNAEEGRIIVVRCVAEAV